MPDPPSLVDLRNRVEAMLPRIDLGELILEVMAWYPGFAAAFTALSGSATRLDDLHVTIAATLTAHALNVGDSSRRVAEIHDDEPTTTPASSPPGRSPCPCPPQQPVRRPRSQVIGKSDHRA